MIRELSWQREKTDHGMEAKTHKGQRPEMSLEQRVKFKNVVVQLATFKCVHGLSTCILVFMDSVVPLEIIKLHS